MGHIGRIVLVVTLLSPLTAPVARGALVTNLGVLPGHTHSGASDVNDAGVVVGVSFTIMDSPPGPIPPVNRAFRYTGSGPIEALSPVGTNTVATGINSEGTIVGYSGLLMSGTGAGLTWTSPGPLQNIANAGEATAINDNGVVVGYVPQAGVTQHAYRYDGTGPPQDLGVIAGTRSYAHDINNAGVIVGWSNAAVGSTVKRAARYVNGAWSLIPGLSSFTDTEAQAVNEAGDIVGLIGNPGGAFRFKSSTGTTFALTSPFGSSRQAWDINDAGFVVGSVDGARAALWRPDNTFVDLDAWLDAVAPAEGALWTLNAATGINNNGLIVGRANGGVAFVLDASSLVPEPSSAAVLALFGAAGLSRRHCRRRGHHRGETDMPPVGR